jgi:poly-gamma-glutamate synthesis protein (capsule biosynthesis protein)
MLGAKITLNSIWHNITLTANVTDTKVSSELPTKNVPIAVQTEEPKVTTSKQFKIVIGGDVMMDRGIRLLGNNLGYDSLFEKILLIFKSADISIVNLEGTITSNPSKTLLPNNKFTKELYFTFATTTAEVLANTGIDYVSLANNHTDNFKIKGLEETKKWLNIANVGYFGDPWNSSSTESLIEKDGFKIALIGYHEFQPGLARITSSIKRLHEEGYFVIILPHWGDEYVTKLSDRIQNKAQTFVDAGADAIIGSHPHVVMKPEWIGDIPVFYSLGNLLFDQYFSSEVMTGNIVELDISNDEGKYNLDNVSVYEISLASRNGIEIVSGPTPFAQ